MKTYKQFRIEFIVEEGPGVSSSIFGSRGLEKNSAKVKEKP